MTLTATSYEHEAKTAISLVSDMRQIGVETPAPIAAEIEIYRDLERARAVRERERGDAVAKLYDVDPGSFGAAREELVEVSLRASVAGETDAICRKAAVGRLQAQVFDVARSWQETVAEIFNQAVADFELNEVAGDLPNFADPMSFNVTTLDRSSGHAIEQWRNAVVHLDPLWLMYCRLAKVRGDTILGPVGADDLSTNLYTACVLGRPQSWRAAQTAASWFVRIANNDDVVRSFGDFMPFVVPSLAGYALRLNTPGEAHAIRNQLQNAA